MGLRVAFFRHHLGYCHGKKTRFSKKKLALPKNPTWEYVKYVLVPPIAADHKQIDNKPWHPTGR
jgi:hypothetical protein